MMFKSLLSLALVAGTAAFVPGPAFVGRARYTGLSMSADIAEKMKAIVVEQLGVDAAKVVPEASFIGDLGADSLDTVELIMAIEEKFDTEIPEEDATKIATVQDAIDYVAKLK